MELPLSLEFPSAKLIIKEHTGVFWRVKKIHDRRLYLHPNTRTDDIIREQEREKNHPEMGETSSALGLPRPCDCREYPTPLNTTVK